MKLLLQFLWTLAMMLISVTALLKQYDLGGYHYIFCLMWLLFASYHAWKMGDILFSKD